MILKQMYLSCLSQASYFIADEKTKSAVVVDPRRDVDEYVKEAEKLGVRIDHVFLTHFHADFVSGHVELRERTGATIHLGARAKADYSFQPIIDGQMLDLGDVRFRFLETPGHTPESVCVLVFDLSKSADKPHAVLTGDTLFIGDVGRPDLLASVGVSGNELATMLYHSLQEKLLTLPDETLVYPAHGAGSMCGKNLSSDTVSTIGDQRKHNYALQPMSEMEFIRLVTSEQPEAPAYFAFNANMNRQERVTLDSSIKSHLKPLLFDQLTKAVDSGAQVLDVREADAYARGHVRGSINVGLGGRFAQWVGTVIDPKRSIIIVADSEREQEAAIRLGRIGYDQIVGYLQGGAAAFPDQSEWLRTIERVSAQTLSDQRTSEEPPFILDVRGANEFKEKRIDGSLNIPVMQLYKQLEKLPRNRKVAIHCASGYRSSIAAGILEQAGFTDLEDVVGGIAAWEKAGLPTS